MNEKSLKVLVCFLMVALAATSGLAVTFYQQQILLRQDFERLQESYGQLQNSYASLQQEYQQLQNRYKVLQQDYQQLQTMFDNLTMKHAELVSQYTILSAQHSNLTETYNQLLDRYEELSQSYGQLQNSYASLQQEYSVLNENYKALNENYRVLSQNYSALTASYETLEGMYLALNELYKGLQSNYTALESTYTALENAYNNLLEQHETLVRLWNEPLEYVVEPSVEELIEWLELDQTDSLVYDPEKFLCGDFTIMLIQHAKEMNWRMLFTVIEYDLYEENPNGVSSHHGMHGHAFASIFTTEGIVYIEPQTDLVFYIHPEGQPDVHVEIQEWGYLNATDWLGGVIFVQYYNRMADPAQYMPKTHVTNNSKLTLSVLGEKVGDELDG